MKFFTALCTSFAFIQLVRADDSVSAKAAVVDYENWGNLIWQNFEGVKSKEMRITQYRKKGSNASNPLAYTSSGGSLIFRAIDAGNSNYPNPESPKDKRVARLTIDGNSGDSKDAAALMFYSHIPKAGMQLGVGPGGDPDEVLSPHVAALRVQRVNGANEEGMVWVATPIRQTDPTNYDGSYKLAVIQTKQGKIRPFKIVSGEHVVTCYNEDGSKSEFWKGYKVSHHEPRNGALIYETFVKYPVLNTGADLYTNPVAISSPAGTEASFKDSDGLIKKAIKQESGDWTRISDNTVI